MAIYWPCIKRKSNTGQKTTMDEVTFGFFLLNFFDNIMKPQELWCRCIIIRLIKIEKNK